MGKKNQKRSVIVALCFVCAALALIIYDAYEPPEPSRAARSPKNGCHRRGECPLCSIENMCPIDRCVLLTECKSSALRLNPFDLSGECKVARYLCVTKEEYQATR